MIDHLIITYINDTENPKTNYDLGIAYEEMGQTAAAISFFLRAAERTDSNELAYECLLRVGNCFDRQKNRNYTVRSMYQSAMCLLPNRPEAYYLLSRIYESENNHFESYVVMELALNNTKDQTNINVGYHGRWCLLFQKAVAAWWRGRGMESREIFQTLLNNHWNEMDEAHRKMSERNIVSLGSGPVSYAFRMYDASMHERMRYKFPGSDKLTRNYSQVYQDLFILSVLDGKRNGTFLEIGGADPYMGNNTCLLEKEYGWKGVSLEYDNKFIDKYKQERPTTDILCTDALTVDYSKLIKDKFNTDIIDYLQLDIEPAKNTYDCMLKIPFDKVKFRVITYEHDYYADITRSYKEKSREFLRSKGYLLVANDISPDGICTFEDWWVHPDIVDMKIVNQMMDDTPIKAVTEYMFPIEKKIISEDIIKPIKPRFAVSRRLRKTSWIVDSFYDDPDWIRKLALEQEYLEGGLGRGFIGRRTHQQFLFPGLKESFQDIMGKTITKWEEYGMNGRFQIAWSGEPLVYHCDSQMWGGMLYLSPSAPFQCGTTLYAHKQTRARTYYDQGWDAAWKDVPGDCHLDGTPFEPVDVLGNVYNRLVIFDASCIHSASQYFGTVPTNSRLWQMFFFDTE
jgi:tetratricopeptide (TPR) repeat protein